MFAISGRRPQDNLYPPQRRRVHRRLAHQRHARRHQRPAARRRRRPRVQRRHRHLLRHLRQAPGRTDLNRHRIRHQSPPRLRLRVPAQLSFFDARNYFDQARIPEFQRNNFGALARRSHPEGQALPLRQLRRLPPEPRPLRRHPRARQLPSSRRSRSRQREAASATSGRSQMDPSSSTPTASPPASPTPTPTPRSTSAKTSAPRASTTTSRPNDLLFAVYTIDDSTAQHAHAEPLLARQRRASASRSSACRSSTSSRRDLLNTARVGYSRASFYFLGSVPADIQAITPAVVARQAHRRHRHRRFHRIQRSLADHRRRRQRRLQQRHHAQPLHLRRPHLLDPRPPPDRSRRLAAAAPVQRQPRAEPVRPGQLSHRSPPSSPATIKTFTVVPAPTELGWRCTFGRGYLEDTIQAHAAPRTPRRPPLRVHQRLERVARPRRQSTASPTESSTPTPPSAPAPSPTTARSSSPSRASASPGIRPRQRPHRIRAGVGLHHSLLDTPRLPPRPGRALQHHLSHSGTSPSACITPPHGACQPISPSTVQTDIATPDRLSLDAPHRAAARPATPPSPSATSARTATTRSSPRT